MRAILGSVPCHPTVIELLDPLGWVRESSPARDSESGETTVLDIPIGWLEEGVDIPDEAGFEELDHLFMVIQLLFVVHFLGGQVLVKAVSAGFQGDDQSVDDGAVGVCGEIVAGDGTME